MLFNLPLINYLLYSGARESESVQSNQDRASYLNALVCEAEHCLQDISKCLHRQSIFNITNISLQVPSGGSCSSNLSSALIKVTKEHFVPI
ncbi:hypothetical protein QR98_0046250 [Sarcoptes scabiei]|uniref:Uncharacterized protein n=1 Tax=Sarcoptes scabiei TaxID=52283 RepID=A0A132A5B6_SARSC|nr:hypothetical protein QR98_0046250 [Sarcoptes scabiei]